MLSWLRREWAARARNAPKPWLLFPDPPTPAPAQGSFDALWRGTPSTVDWSAEDFAPVAQHAALPDLWDMPAEPLRVPEPIIVGPLELDSTSPEPIGPAPDVLISPDWDWNPREAPVVVRAWGRGWDGDDIVPPAPDAAAPTQPEVEASDPTRDPRWLARALCLELDEPSPVHRARLERHLTVILDTVRPSAPSAR